MPSLSNDLFSSEPKTQQGYVGRFAPTPSGPLHQGSLYTALASYLDAKAHHGKWLLRIEDIDPPREQVGATQAIIDCLAAHHLFWDGEICLQSKRTALYQQALDNLLQQQHGYYCQCSRQQLSNCQGYYNGHCRHLQLTKTNHSAVRLKTDALLDTCFIDRLLGEQKEPHAPNGCCHDFVIFRRDGLFAYQLAVVVDDIAQGVTDIVRGSDILDSTFKQAWLYHYLDQTRPNYLHLPVLAFANGQKLSKQNKAEAVNLQHCKDNLLLALNQLKQTLPPSNKQHSLDDILQWAVEHWNIQAIQRQLFIAV